MKKPTSLLTFCICFALLGFLFPTGTGARQISFGNQQMTGKNTVQTDPPVRSPGQVEVFRRLIMTATERGAANVIVATRGDQDDRAELLRQLAPFGVRVISLYSISPNMIVTLEANAAAIIYMRDSHLVTGIQENSAGHPSVLPERSPEELAYFQRAIEAAQMSSTGTARTIVGLNVSFIPEGNLTPEQRAAQREAIRQAQGVFRFF